MVSNLRQTHLLPRVSPFSADKIFLPPDLLDQVNDCVITADLDGLIAACNPAVVEVYGYTADELQGQNLAVLYPHEQQLFVSRTLLSEVVKAGEFHAHLRSQTKHGKDILVYLSVSLLRDEEGKPSGMVGISTRAVAQSSLNLEEHKYFEVLTEALPQLIWWADKAGQVNFAPSRTLKFFDTQVAALAGNHWIDFVHPDDRASTHLAWEKGIAARVSFELEHRLRRHDGEYIVHLLKAMPVLDAEGCLTSFIQTSTDISAQKFAESALRQSEKLAVVGKLASSIAHEINNPLESVSNLLYLLAGQGSLDRTAREYVKSAQEELARISEITTQTLRFHKQSTKAVVTRLADVLDSVLAFYKPRIQTAGLHLFREYQSTEPLRCFAGEIRQSLANIIGNAVEATPRGGNLRIRLRPSRDWKTRQKRGVRITIADDGRGIDKESRERLFEPFFTTKGITGTGLGLWITKDLIARHGGTISFHSSTKEGSSGTVSSVFLPFESLMREGQ